MLKSGLSIEEIIESIDSFCPVKVIFNDDVLYNDYDSNIEIEEGVYGEKYPFRNVAPNRIEKFKNYFITSINIEIVSHHHTIFHIKGELPRFL